VIHFAPVPVYQACDRFAFGVTLLVDGKRRGAEVPLRVVRMEPLRRRP
jgi:hypothetical protein